jgi:signal peptidase I
MDNQKQQLFEWKDVFWGIIIALLFAIIIRLSFAELYNVPSESMKPILQKEDMIVVSKMAFSFGVSGEILGITIPQNLRITWNTPKKNDIIVFKAPAIALKDFPPISETVYFVKRIAYGPGDINPINNQIIPYKGMKLDKNDLAWKQFIVDDSKQGLQSLMNKEYIVQHNYYFVLGDNSEQSFDSRFWGLIQEESIMGKPIMICWSKNTSRLGYFIQ